MVHPLSVVRCPLWVVRLSCTVATLTKLCWVEVAGFVEQRTARWAAYVAMGVRLACNSYDCAIPGQFLRLVSLVESMGIFIPMILGVFPLSLCNTSYSCSCSLCGCSTCGCHKGCCSLRYSCCCRTLLMLWEQLFVCDVAYCAQITSFSV